MAEKKQQKKYSAGALDLSVVFESQDAIAQIQKTTRAIRSLTNSITKMQNANLGAQAKRISEFVRTIAEETNGTNITAISKMTRTLNSLTNLPKKLDKIDYDKVKAGFEKLTVAITPFVDKVKEAETGLSSLQGVLSKAGGKRVANLLNGNQSRGGGLFGFAKMGVSLYAIRRFARFVKDILKYGSDYLETMNLWQVAMRDNLDLADEFVSKMNKAYGVSAQTSMQAQATFKNMIGSLGDLSSDTAYKLSEAITQMAFDYSSLYNVSLEKAVDKFQSALAGQVRPIRSISGYDITEKTIHALYQSIGGTKTQRQLSRTEKQLLAILAVFKQMQASGATGDLGKTLNMYANQSRMFAENAKELASWMGIVLVDLMESSNIMKFINASMIFLTEITKAYAKSKGLGEDNYIDGIWESADGATKALDELHGKLADFDKFRSLQSDGSGEDVSIDKVLSDAIAGYTSVIGNATNEARELAETWLEFFGVTKDENGELVFTEGHISKIKGLIEGIFGTLMAITGLFVIKGIVSFGAFLNKHAIKPLISLVAKLATSYSALSMLQKAFVGLSLAIFATSLTNFLQTEMSAMKRMISVVSALVLALTAAAIAFHMFEHNYAMALGVGATVAAGVLQVSTMIPNFEKGASDIDSGTVFRAGEFGKTEAVYTGSNGKTNVANVRQMEQAFYNALSRYGSEDGGKIVVETYLDGEKVYENTTKRAKARGNVWSKA